MKSAVKSRRVLTPSGIKEAIVVIKNGLIADLLDSAQPDLITEDYGDLIIMPGLVDTHVHINEPGRTEWEGFETATKSAAAGGITMLVDMPLNSSPVTVNISALNDKIEASKNKLYTDCGFYGGVTPDNINELEGLIKHGVLGLKAFMIHSGIDDFPAVNEDELKKALKIISGFNIPLLVHAEVDCGFEKKTGYDKWSFESFLSTRPEEWENNAVAILIKLCREFDSHIHIVHLSSSRSLDIIREAKKEGLKLTAETCPHYLYFSSEEIPKGDTRYKCTPPIRDSANREKLWSAVKEDVIDFIVSDHSPCDPALKCTEEGDFEKAWGGISGLQLGISIIWTEAVKRGFTIEDVSRLMSTKPSAFIGLDKKKGRIEKGFDADLIVFDPLKKFTVKGNELFHRHKLTPYEGREFSGVVEAAYLRGKKIFSNGEFTIPPSGIVINKI